MSDLKNFFSLAHRLEEILSKPGVTIEFKHYNPKTIFRRKVSYTIKLNNKEAFTVNGDGVFKFGMQLPLKKNEQKRLLELLVLKDREKRTHP